MVSARTPDFAAEYVAWLRDRVMQRSRGSETVIRTPFLDPFNDGIQLHIAGQGSDLMLHDAGATVDNLLTLGVAVSDSERRQALVRRALAGSPVEFVDGRLQTHASGANFAQRAHFLLSSISRLNGLWMTAVPHSWTDFVELVTEFLDARGVLYTANVSLPGRTVEHPIDFILPLKGKRERLIKLVAAPTTSTAKLVSFTWLELMHTRPASERVVLLNDVRHSDPFSSDSDEQFRNVGEQAIAILQGYSSKVYRWSDRTTPQFAALWRADSN